MTDELGTYICSRFAKQDISASVAFGELTLTIMRSALPKVMTFLKEDRSCDFTHLMDLTCVDTQKSEGRFAVVYHLLSTELRQRIRVKVETDSEIALQSLSKLFASASWYEREIFDMFGLMFIGHPDLRRLLLAENSPLTPLLKRK